MEQPDITEFLGDSDEGMGMVGQMFFGLFFFCLGAGTGWLIWG